MNDMYNKKGLVAFLTGGFSNKGIWPSPLIEKGVSFF